MGGCLAIACSTAKRRQVSGLRMVLSISLCVEPESCTRTSAMDRRPPRSASNLTGVFKRLDRNTDLRTTNNRVFFEFLSVTSRYISDVPLLVPTQRVPPGTANPDAARSVGGPRSVGAVEMDAKRRAIRDATQRVPPGAANTDAGGPAIRHAKLPGAAYGSPADGQSSMRYPSTASGALEPRPDRRKSRIDKEKAVQLSCRTALAPVQSGRLDSNQRPLGPEPSALARLSHAPRSLPSHHNTNLALVGKGKVRGPAPGCGTSRAAINRAGGPGRGPGPMGRIERPAPSGRRKTRSGKPGVRKRLHVPERSLDRTRRSASLQGRQSRRGKARDPGRDAARPSRAVEMDADQPQSMEARGVAGVALAAALVVALRVARRMLTA